MASLSAIFLAAVLPFARAHETSASKTASEPAKTEPDQLTLSRAETDFLAAQSALPNGHDENQPVLLHATPKVMELLSRRSQQRADELEEKAALGALDASDVAEARHLYYHRAALLGDEERQQSRVGLLHRIIASDLRRARASRAFGAAHQPGDGVLLRDAPGRRADRHALSHRPTLVPSHLGANPHLLHSPTGPAPGRFVGRNTYRTENFVVTAANPQFAQQVAELAETTWTRQSMEWFGRPTPRQSNPVQIRVGGPGGGVTNEAGNIRVGGNAQEILEAILPHEVQHSLFIRNGQALPLWAHEGSAMTAEEPSHRDFWRGKLMEYLREGRLYNMRDLFAVGHSNRTPTLQLYAQSHSVVDYLIERAKSNGGTGKPEVLAFFRDGVRTRDWDGALHRNFGEQNAASLQRSWLAWVRQGSPRAETVPAQQPPRADVAADQPAPEPDPHVPPRTPPGPRGPARQQVDDPNFDGDDPTRNHVPDDPPRTPRARGPRRQPRGGPPSPPTRGQQSQSPGGGPFGCASPANAADGTGRNFVGGPGLWLFALVAARRLSRVRRRRLSKA